LINLAGRTDADDYIRREFTRCGIDCVNVERTNSEVPYTIIGKLGDFTFRRAWYYYIVEGEVPLTIANKLYNDPVGRTDVRVDGHCGCPAPQEPWISIYDKEGKKLIRQKDYDSIQKII
jgi:hypothetical protein